MAHEQNLVCFNTFGEKESWTLQTYKAHDEKNEAGMGDIVEIMETRRLSKSKSWRLVRVLTSRSAPTVAAEEATAASAEA